ncbi:M48 family metallopeptidase [Roseinatronobacter alkalisoli]|uniref:SprT family zinc-dependent metalloprotease n=1 Tax=Roseinatronobacter alkalisoli TaxID=3028235 RepID=A0ABT5T5P4_9RHOB|nr:SprT family zinc-dependent metalloprotease [Roseinatronobacter sp. HJB301]MDD7969721.1 SprT family zinc-dependent metalloprotease [Roseinatronobacter sp. HJB301]
MPRLPEKTTESTAFLDLDGARPVAVVLRRSAQTRRISLRVSGLDGRVTLSIPKSLPKATALGFLSEKKEWLRKALEGVPQQIPVIIGSTILFQGTPLQIACDGEARRIRLEGQTLFVPADPDGTITPARVAAFLKDQARRALVSAAHSYAARLGKQVAAISLRDTRSRWGSCTADGRLMFSWRLIMAPPPVLDYVAAHEAAHLCHMDHSRAYWACVSGLMPDYQRHRAWLRQNGAHLHGYRF